MSQKNILDTFIESVQNCFDAHTAALFVDVSHTSDHEEGSFGGGEEIEMRLIACSSLSEKISYKSTLKAGQGLLGWALKSNEFLHATDFKRDTRTLGIYLEDVGIKALMVAPIGGKRSGVIMVDSKNQFAFPEKKQRIFRYMARLSGDIVENYFEGERLGFFNRFLTRYGDLKKGKEVALSALLEITRLDIGAKIAVRHGRPFVETTIPVGIVRRVDHFIRDLKALSLLLLKHRQALVTERFGALKGDIKGKEAPRLGPNVLGIPVLKGKDGDEAVVWVASGRRSLLGWPKGLELLIKDALGQTS